MVEEPKIEKWLLKDIILGAVALFFVVLLGMSAVSYNMLVEQDTNVLQKQANVQTALERRADLIPNTIASIQGSEKFENGTLTTLVELRSQVGQIRSDVASASSASDLQAQGSNLDSAISRLLLIYEQYPTLKTTDQFLQFENQLANTEDQIMTSRNTYNSAVRDYQQVVRSVPTNIYAGAFGFKADRYSVFAADSSKQGVPVVAF